TTFDRVAYPHVLDASWSPDGRTIATAHVDGVVRLWDAADGAPGPTTPGFQRRLPARGLAWSPDGRRLAFPGDGPRLRVWDVAGDGPVADLEQGAEYVCSAAWSPALGGYLASGSADGKVRLRDLDTRRSVAVVDGGPGQKEGPHHEFPYQLAYSPDGE